jgi:ubiquinone/menaquinone biosynthesis C-methylase UbiE
MVAAAGTGPVPCVHRTGTGAWETLGIISGKETTISQTFQLQGQGPQSYERYLVPVIFTPCAEQLLDLAAVRPGERVLDVACGTGIVARGAATKVGAGGSVVGTDLNEGMLEVATAVTADAPVGIQWHAADAAALPLPDGAFDLVCCQQGLQFFTDRPQALRELHRVLAPGGRLALGVWRAIDHHPVFAAFVEALERHAGPETAALMRRPFSGPDRDGLRKLLADAGFGGTLVRIGGFLARFASPAEFLRQQVASSPLAGPVGELDEDRREALRHQLDQALEPWADDDGVAVPMQTWLVTASRQG